MRRYLLAALALAAAAPVGAAVVKGPSLAAIVLRPDEVGKGFHMQVIPGGNRVQGQVTLDLCDQSFRSEKLRVARLQVAYLNAGNQALLSNEVVRYRPGGTAQAMRELQHVASHCPNGTVKYRVTRLSDGRLLKPYLAVMVHATGTRQGRRVSATAFGVYQIRKNVLSAVYTSGVGTIKAQRRLALDAAAKTAKKLKALLR